MNAARPSLLLAYYGDDLTGSTDALEALTLAGIRTVLFMEPPKPEDLARYDGIQAVGVAGLSRAMDPGALASVLPPAFSALKALGPRHVHYKVCSTFDSSPTVGSIGRVIDLGADLFRGRFIPVVGGAPALGRYCVFGNLFARAEIGGAGEIYRLDRHPSMSRHPSTPADESDLRVHLSRQTRKSFALFDVLKLALPAAEADSALDRMIAGGAEVVLFDALDAAQLRRIGEILDAQARDGQPLFSVGPSSVETALASYWVGRVILNPPSTSANADGANGGLGITRPTHDPILVASGSCSPVTAGQIDWALAHGFAGVVIDTAAALQSDDRSAVDAPAIAAAVRHLQAGLSVVLHTSRGNSDPRLVSAFETRKRRNLDQTAVTSRLGAVLGRTIREILGRIKLSRFAIAGGDTSSHAARALGIESLEMIAASTPGAPLCRARAPGSPMDGREVVFKGGQVGGVDYFGTLAAGQHL